MRGVYTTLLTLLFTVMCLTTEAQQSSIEAQKRVIASIESEIAKGEKEIATIRKGKSSTESKVSALAAQVTQRNRLLEAQNSQIELLKRDIDRADSTSLCLSDELQHESAIYANMVREAYRNYSHSNFISYIFAADSFNDIARRIVNIRRVAELRERRMSTIDSLSTEILAERELLSRRKLSLDSVVKDITRQRSLLQRDINSARDDIRTMNNKERQALQAKALQQQKLSTAIEELRALSKGNTQGASFSAKTSNLNLPVVGGKVKRYMDNMAEVVGAKGSSVVAIYEGKVVDVKQNRITGKYDIYIAHGEYITSYAGLRTAAVTKDSTVVKNQRIGEVGAAVDIITMESEYKIIFGIYPPSPSTKMKASDCFKK